MTLNPIVAWSVARARMIFFFVVLSIGAGYLAYTGLPKEGSPNIDVPLLYISVPYPGVSAEDSEQLIVRPLENELRTIEGIDKMTSFASEGHAGVLLEFDFDWDKSATVAEVREKVDDAQTEFPADAEEPSVSEVNFSAFPILLISLSGDLPERTLLRTAKDLQREVEALTPVLEAGMAGRRDEMLELVVDPIRLEAYDVTATELLSVVSANNRLVAAGALEGGTSAFSVKLPGAFETAADLYALPIKVSGDQIVTVADLAEIRRTFEDPTGTARYNGEATIALQVKKRLGENIIDTVDLVKTTVAAEVAKWPEPLQQSLQIDFSMDESEQVKGMVGQLESSVLTAVSLVMVVVLAALGLRAAMLVGLAIPCSFLLTFALMAVLGQPINNMVMFGLILAVGMLVDGAIVVTEYADKRIAEGSGPMRAYSEAASRMFWPIVSSTATTLCAFLPMLFWPGMPGQFMGQLPVTLIFVLSASLIVALVYLPVLGGIAGRLSRTAERLKDRLRAKLNRPPKAPPPAEKPYRRSWFGHVIAFVTGNPVLPFVALAIAGAAIYGVFTLYGEKGKGVEFFVDTEPERAVVYVRARGNMSLDQKDQLVRIVEDRILAIDGVRSVFASAGESGLDNRGGEGPQDSIGQVQIELEPCDSRCNGRATIAKVEAAIANLPGIFAELAKQEDGPQQGKPVQLRLTSDNWEDLLAATALARERFEQTSGLVDVGDTRPLPGIDWRLQIDRTQAGRFGADISTVGTLLQLATRGATLGTYRPLDADEELDIRARFPASDRNLETLDTLRLRTESGLVPLSNFISGEAAPKLGEINRFDRERFFLVRADVTESGLENVIIPQLQEWLETNPLPASVGWAFAGDQEEQNESMAFLGMAFIGALGLMFVILLAQFNSFYNAVLVLAAVVMSTAGVLIGMMVMGQKFSIIMTGTGVVALAGIVVNNNIVLIDTFQELSRRMPRLEAIVRTAEMRIRPVLLTTITTMAGLTPMMFATSLNFFDRSISYGAPTALWWVQLATAVVFGLGFATILTLVVTPTALAAREWFRIGVLRGDRYAVTPDGVGSDDPAPQAAVARQTDKEKGGRDWLKLFRAARHGEPGNDPRKPPRIDAAE